MAGLETLLDTELADLLDDLAGLAWIPGVDLILDGIRNAAAAATAGDLSLDDTQTLLTTIANPHGPDLTQALALLVQHLTNAATNPALNSLSPQAAKTVQHLGEIHVFESGEMSPREYTNEAAGRIAPH